MDHIFAELIGKPQLNSSKIITTIAENFNFNEDHAKFLKAILAIPAIKQLPLEKDCKRLIQIGSPHRDIIEHLSREEWVINVYDDSTLGQHPCDRLRTDLSTSKRSIIFINDVSRLLLSNQDEGAEILKLIDHWKRERDHFVVVLFQSASPNTGDKFLRNIEYMSDAVIKTRSHKDCYFQSIWYQPMPTHKTLIPAKVETSYCTCKIGKSYWTCDLLCFYDRKPVSKDYDPDHDQIEVSHEKIDHEEILRDEDDDDNGNDRANTLPYFRAQNPEQSKIFYYSDKNDDIDEDDPDFDLGI